MGARQTLASVAIALLAPYRLDIKSNEVVKILPELEDTGTFQINDEDYGMDFKVVAGTSKNLLIDRGAEQITITGLPIVSDSSLSVGSFLPTDLIVSNTTTTKNLSVTSNATMVNATVSGATTLADVTTNALTVTTLNTTGLITAGAGLGVTGGITATTTIAATGALSGASVATPGAIQCGSLVANTTCNANEMTVTGDFIANTVRGVSIVTSGGSIQATTSLSGSAVSVSGNVQGAKIIGTDSVNTAKLKATTSVNSVAGTFTGTMQVNKLLSTTDVNSVSMKASGTATVNKLVSTTDCNATSVYASTKVNTVALTATGTAQVNKLVSTTDVNCAGGTFTGKWEPTGGGYMHFKTTTISTNATLLNTDHFGGTVIGVTPDANTMRINMTTPDNPAGGVTGKWFFFFHFGGGGDIEFGLSGGGTTNLMLGPAFTIANTVTCGFRSIMFVIGTPTRWVFHPAEGVTLTTA